ncbi:hypothetical protein ACFX2A_025186 [Malus domestica]
MLVQEQGSGFLIMAVQHTHHLGERFGWQYSACISGRETTLCRQSSGPIHLCSHSIQQTFCAILA